MVINCKDCRSIMDDLDGLNFICPVCGRVHYHHDEAREQALIYRGRKTCPICGHVLIIQNGYYTCLSCCKNLIQKNNPHERWYAWSRHSNKDSMTILPSLTLLFSFTSIYASLSFIWMVLL